MSKRTIEQMKQLGPVGERALAVLASAMEDSKVPWSCRIQAASLIADRAFGRSPQAVGLEMTRRLNEMTIEELRVLRAKYITATMVAPAAIDHEKPGL